MSDTTRKQLVTFPAVTVEKADSITRALVEYPLLKTRVSYLSQALDASESEKRNKNLADKITIQVLSAQLVAAQKQIKKERFWKKVWRGVAIVEPVVIAVLITAHK
ncbi:hypothetical protein ACFFJX_08165 [Pseudarcicella hirudinis]|uniref:hypothetical protein n=1 Tax=Pseudarcicella hirudinis TaxID=1079859 RepID=UPI000B8345E6